MFQSCLICRANSSGIRRPLRIGRTRGRYISVKSFELRSLPAAALVATIADNSVVLYVNGNRVTQSKDWAKPGIADVAKYLVVGRNVFAAQATNGAAASTQPDAENPAAFWMLASIRDLSQDRIVNVGTDGSWRCAKKPAEGWQAVEFDDSTWASAAELNGGPDYQLLANLTKAKKPYRLQQVRSCWANNDALMTALGRPNREQVVTYRSSAATTLQARIH